MATLVSKLHDVIKTKVHKPLCTVEYIKRKLIHDNICFEAYRIDEETEYTLIAEDFKVTHYVEKGHDFKGKPVEVDMVQISI